MHRMVVTLQIYICDDEDDHYDFSHDEFQRSRIQYKDENYIMFRDQRKFVVFRMMIMNVEVRFAGKKRML